VRNFYSAGGKAVCRASFATNFSPANSQTQAKQNNWRTIVLYQTYRQFDTRIQRRCGRYLLLLEEQTLSSLNSLALLGLSQRETEVLAWVIQGKDNKEIATQLSIHPSTVRKHLENIYRKLGVQSRTEAISQALAKLGFLDSLPLKIVA
jgi:DNA-binding CsgD family transcriptional regulator